MCETDVIVERLDRIEHVLAEILAYQKMSVKPMRAEYASEIAGDPLATKIIELAKSRVPATDIKKGVKSQIGKSFRTTERALRDLVDKGILVPEREGANIFYRPLL